MTKSSTASITVKAKARSLSIWFEDAQGNQITEVSSGGTFYICGEYLEDNTPLSNENIHIYQTDSAGNPTNFIATVRTDANGKYSCPTAAPSVSSDTDLYFRAYDDEQKPAI